MKRRRTTNAETCYTGVVEIHRRPCEEKYLEQLFMVPLSEEFKAHITESAKDGGMLVNKSLIDGAGLGFIYALFLTHEIEGPNHFKNMGEKEA